VTTDAAPRARKLVVAGLIVDAAGRVLITQRRATDALPLAWELPGGKVEPGEAPVDALVRELREELGIAAEVGRIWDVLFHAYPAFDLVMLVYACRITGGTSPRPLEVEDLAWHAPDRLPADVILPADRPLVDRLAAEGVDGLRI
jgi:8-oxo-dGTP diphosphatase